MADDWHLIGTRDELLERVPFATRVPRAGRKASGLPLVTAD